MTDQTPGATAWDTDRTIVRFPDPAGRSLYSVFTEARGDQQP